jgi:hypothetical protein
MRSTDVQTNSPMGRAPPHQSIEIDMRRSSNQETVGTTKL